MIKRFGEIQKLSLNERGIALVTSLLILTALTGIAVTAMNNTTIETMISGNDFQSQKRIYAAEGAANLVFASLPDMVSTNTINGLLAWSYNNKKANRGDLTSSSTGFSSALGMGDMSTFYDPEPGIAVYSVRIEDNKAKTDNIEDKNLYNDVDGTVLLKVFRTSSAITSQELEIEIGPLRLLNHDAAVNLIDPNSVISLSDNCLINASGSDPEKDGMAIPDSFRIIDNQENVKPGIKYGANLSSEEVRDFKKALTRYITPITPPAADDPDNPNYTVTVGEGDTRLTGISYLQGDLRMTNKASGSGILIIEEYNDTNNVDHMSLTLEGAEFDGLIIMFPKNRDPNFEDRVKIILMHVDGEDSSIDGIIVAGSSSDKGTEFDIYGPIKINYDKTEAEDLLANRFVVTNWSRLK